MGSLIYLSLVVYIGIASFQVVNSQLPAEKFHSVEVSGNTRLCAASAPSTSSSARSKVDCMQQCTRVEQCDGVNYLKSESVCNRFDYRPQTYTNNQTDCQYFRRSSHEPCYNNPPAIYPLIDASSCSFPYTMNGQLYHNCALNESISNFYSCSQFYCYMANRTIGNCLPPADYVATAVNYTISVSGQTDRVTLSIFGWIAFMWRKTGSADGPWDLPWTSYVNGFGFNSTYLWLGLERIHQLTTTGNWRLRLEYTMPNNYWVSAEYWTFTVGDSSSSYIINFSGFSGDDGDTLGFVGPYARWTENGMKFSTKDVDNDGYPGVSCNPWFTQGGWWYNWCGLFFPTDIIPKFSREGGTYQYSDEIHVMMKTR